MNSEDQSSLDENTETQDIKGNLRKVIVFLVVVTSLAAIYQIMIFNFVLPNREIHWQKTTLPQVQTYDEQGRRFAVLVLLEQDLGDPEISRFCRRTASVTLRNSKKWKHLSISILYT